MWEDTHYAAHTQAEITHHEKESPVTVQFLILDQTSL
jgi:hypothetical protein